LLKYTPFGVGLNLTSFGNEYKFLAVEVFTGWASICSGVDIITDIKMLSSKNITIYN